MLAEFWSLPCCLLVATGCLLGAIPLIVGLWKGQKTQLWAVVLGVALGGICAGFGAALLHVEQIDSEGVAKTWRFEALGDVSMSGSSLSVDAQTQLVDGRSITVHVWLPEGVETLHYGDVFEAYASLSRPSESSASYSWRNGTAAQANVSTYERKDRSDMLGLLLVCRNKVLSMLSLNNSDNELTGDTNRDDMFSPSEENPQDNTTMQSTGPRSGAYVLAALVCGWKEDLRQSSVYQSFKVAGLAHLVAVSGAHLSIVAVFVTSMLAALRVPRLVATALQIGLLLCYLVLAAAPPSAIRAAFMAFCAMLSFSAKRRPAAINALAICIIICIALKPTTAMSVPFTLSALSTLGILIFSGLFSSWIQALIARIPGFARDALALTCASGLLTTPFSAALFAQIPLVAPLANMVVAPLFPFVCAGGLLVCVFSLFIPPLSGLLLSVCCAATEGFVALVELLSRIPYASIPVDGSPLIGLLLSVSIASILWIVWPSLRPRFLVGALLVFLCFAIGAIVVLPRFAPDEIVMLDVGQGDAILLRSKGSVVLIDTGNHDQLLRQALARHGVAHIDAVIISHSDDDHMGSLASLKGVVQVDTVLLARDALTCTCTSCRALLHCADTLVGTDAVQGLSIGDQVQVGVFRLVTVWPEAYVEDGENADSLSLLSTADCNDDGRTDWSALFVGDAENEQLTQMLAESNIENIDIYKVGHHGSKNAIDNETACALSPEIALIGVGANNRYGHPSEEALSALEQAGTEVFRTDEQGDVSCEITADKITVHTLR